MTEDSVMLSLKELSALEERRVFEEEQRVRLEQQAKRLADEKAAEAARVAAEREASSRAAVQEARERAEREQIAREAAIREAELLKAKLCAEADQAAKDRAARAAEIAEAAAAASRAAQANASVRASRGLIAAAGVSAVVAALAIGLGAQASRRADQTDVRLAVLAATLSDERATSARLGADLAKRDEENRALERAVEDARRANASALLASNATDKPPTTPLAGRGEGGRKPASMPGGGVGIDSRTCDPLDPLCGFKK